MQRGSEDRKRSLGHLRWALQNEETQQKFVRSAQVWCACYQGHVPRGPVSCGWLGELACGPGWELTAAFGSPRLDGSIRTLTRLFTSSLADLQLEAARCLHELSHSSVPVVAEACLPVTSYLLTYLSGHSLEFTVRSTCMFAGALAPGNPLVWLVLTSSGQTWLTWQCWWEGALWKPLEAKIFLHHNLVLGAGLFPVPRCYGLPLKVG